MSLTVGPRSSLNATFPLCGLAFRGSRGRCAAPPTAAKGCALHRVIDGRARHIVQTPSTHATARDRSGS